MATKTILITGADGGLGTSVTKSLLEAGYILTAATRDDAASKRLEDAFPDAIGKTLFPVKANLSVDEEVASLVSQTTGLCALVHLAGGYTAGNLVSDYSAADFDFLMQLNAKPTFLLLKYTMPLLKQSGNASIITIGAKPALHPVAANSVYTASKSAVIALTLSAAEEGRQAGVRANCIVPAALQTPGNLSWASNEVFQTFTPLQDVADTIVYLVSDAAKGITGTIIPMYNKISS